MSFLDSVAAAAGITGSGFVQRLLQVQISLAQGSGGVQPTSFPGGATSTTIGGTVATQLRMRCRIQNSGAPLDNMAQLSIWGLDFPTMQQLSTLGMVWQMIPRNTITISAGDQVSGLSQVFSGDIIAAYADFNSAPDVPMHFECMYGGASAAQPVAPTQYPGGASIQTIFSNFASQLGLQFEGNNVPGSLPPSVFDGSIISQVKKAAFDANVNATVVDGGKTLAITPLRTARSGTAFVIAPPPLGAMIGYPSYTQFGIRVDTLFNPNIKFLGPITIQSSVLKTSFTGVLLKYDLALDSFVPNGEWRSSCEVYSTSAPVPILAPR